MSIVDVAKKAGVSVATVSRVLNGNTAVRPELARHVLEVMEELRYKPRKNRPGPRPKKTSSRKSSGLLGVVLRKHAEDFLQNDYMNRTFTGITNEARKLGYQSVVIGISDVGEMPQVIRERRVDGLILLDGTPTTKHAPADAFHPLPCVQVGGLQPSLPQIDHVVPDSQAAGMIAADFLMSKSCKHPAYLNHVPGHPGFPIRWSAFRDRLASCGVDAKRFVPQVDREDSSDQWVPQYMKPLMTKLLDQLLVEAPETDGIFLPTDQQAAVCHFLLKEKGIKSGKDITLVSCNNDGNWLAMMDPRPATIDLRPDEIGRQAVRRLLQRLEDPLSGPVVLLATPQLVIPTSDH